MSDKPKVDPLLAHGPPPGTYLRPEAAPKPRPKAKKKSAAPSAGPTTVSSSASFPASAAGPVDAELLEPGALIAASGNGPAAAAGLAAAAPAPFGARPKSRKERELERIAQLDASIRLEASRTALHTLAASQVPEDGSKPEGWSERKFRTAKDARMSHREGPSYIQHAARIVESFRRSESLEKREGRPSASLNANITFYVRNDIKNTYNYEVIEQKGDGD